MRSVKSIKISDIHWIKDLLDRSSRARKTFRYFEKRHFSVLENHLLTIVVFEDSKPMGYGHLDLASDGVWLGIFVADDAKGRGYGKALMKELTRTADVRRIPLKLTVDKENLEAIRLYERFHFRFTDTVSNSYVMERKEAKAVYISSLAFFGQSAEDMISLAVTKQWPIEFSSGMSYRPDMENLFVTAPIPRLAHNYFPAPEVPFVLNLASTSESIRQRSIDHCLNGLRLTKKAKAPFFAAHAGFCIDPDLNELGRQIRIVQMFSKSDSKRLFQESLTQILIEADRLSVDFLIENNVIAKFNLTESRENPLLCCESSEIERTFSSINHPRFGLLLDTAHLKVSCKTLSLDLRSETGKILPFVKAFHHSDNDGLIDDNQLLPDDYWFLEYMHDQRDKIHVLEVKRLSEDQITQQINLLSSAWTLKN